MHFVIFGGDGVQLLGDIYPHPPASAPLGTGHSSSSLHARLGLGSLAAHVKILLFSWGLEFCWQAQVWWGQGSNKFCATLFSDLLKPHSEALTVVSDVVLAVGTNDLKREGMNPSVLARKMSRYVKNICSKHQTVHFFISGVLPTFSDNLNINSKMRNIITTFAIFVVRKYNLRLTFRGGLKPTL